MVKQKNHLVDNFDQLFFNRKQMTKINQCDNNQLVDHQLELSTIGMQSLWIVIYGLLNLSP